MNLIEENFQANQEKKENKSKTLRLMVLVGIVIVVISIFVIIGYLYYLEKSKLVVTLDGQLNDKIKEILVIEDEKVYAPIKQMASYFGYESYSGEYIEKSESSSKCYVHSEKEVVDITLGSNKLYKVDLTNSSINYKYTYTEEPIKAINGELYGTSETIEKIFNVDFEYDNKKNKIDIYTIPYLFEAYSKVMLNKGYAQISDQFSNQKAILDGIFVVINEKNNYGVVDSKGKTILENKYDYIEYIPESKDFIVKSNGKYGIMSKTSQTKVDINYDGIELMDSDSQLYIVENDRKYGIVDFSGNTKLYAENDEIGIDISSFLRSGVRNKYLILDKFIPIKKGEKWGLFDKKVKQVTEFKYDGFGCKTSIRNGVNLLSVPYYDVFIAEIKEKYTILNSDAKQLFNPVADNIYMEVNGGEKYFYIVVNEKKYNAIEYLERIGIKKNNDSNDDEQSNTSQSTNNRENANAEENESSEEENNNSNENVENNENSQNENNENVENEEENNQEEIDESEEEQENENDE